MLKIYSNSVKIIIMKKPLRETQRCALAVLRRSQKISLRRRPPSRGRGRTKIKSAGDGHYLYLQTQLGEDRCMQFRVIVVTDPPTTNTQTHRMGLITIHGAAASLARCVINNVLCFPADRQTQKGKNVFSLAEEIKRSSRIFVTLVSGSTASDSNLSKVAVWCSGKALVSINAVALHGARLVVGWVTAFG